MKDIHPTTTDEPKEQDMPISFTNAQEVKATAKIFHDLAEADARKSGHPYGSEEYWQAYQETYGIMNLARKGNRT